MKDFLIGLGIGFAVGAVMCKTCKPVAEAVQKGKKMVEEKINEGKDMVKKNIQDASKQLSKSKSQK